MSNEMQKALAVTCAAELSSWNGEFCRLYFGSEFCRYLLPTLDETKRMLDFCVSKNAAFTLLTPPVGDKQIEGLEELLALLVEFGVGTEVVFNDWGVFSLCSGLDLEPVVGRLLVRQRKDPRISGFIDNLPASGARRYRECGINSDMAAFLALHGCRRAELDIVSQGLSFAPELVESFSFSVHEPYTFVWTTRDCAFAPSSFDATKCSKMCREKSFRLEHPDMPESMICKGNSLFVSSSNCGEKTASFISRTVVHVGEGK